ncbi:MAG: GNAT family N-acetyltransferase [Bacilli bacterium]|nr:GNAT family N-acetyltransferase [Bacilli bacterium]
MEIEIRETKDLQDIRLRNDPFPVFQKAILTLNDGKWGISFEDIPPFAMRFPDEEYPFEPKECLYLAAYESKACIGLAIAKKEEGNYLYLHDLKVKEQFRKQGVASLLLEETIAQAKKLGYHGLSTIAQDNNAAAIRFYLKMGFLIGGYDNHTYHGTLQEGKGDLYLYLDF